MLSALLKSSPAGGREEESIFNLRCHRQTYTSSVSDLETALAQAATRGLTFIYYVHHGPFDLHHSPIASCIYQIYLSLLGITSEPDVIRHQTPQ